MTRTEVAALAFRLAALYLCVQALIFLASGASFLFQVEPDEYGRGIVVGAGVSGTLLAVLGLLLYVLAPGLARRTGGDAATGELVDRLAIGSIALRLAGIVLWEAAIERLPSVITWGVVTVPGAVESDWAVIALFLAVGTWLFARATSLGRRWFGSAGETTEASRTLAAIAFAAVGLWIVVGALPEVVAELTATLRLGELAADGFYPPRRTLVAGVLRVLLGAALVVGSGAIARAWTRLRTAGIAPTR